jgi:hypothetical protein
MVEELKEFSDSGRHRPLTGTPPEARQIVGEMRRAPGWSNEDRIVFAVGVAGATIIGAIIVLV